MLRIQANIGGKFIIAKSVYQSFQEQLSCVGFSCLIIGIIWWHLRCCSTFARPCSCCSRRTWVSHQYWVMPASLMQIPWMLSVLHSIKHLCLLTPWSERATAKNNYKSYKFRTASLLTCMLSRTKTLKQVVFLKPLLIANNWFMLWL